MASRIQEGGGGMGSSGSFSKAAKTRIKEVLATKKADSARKVVSTKVSKSSQGSVKVVESTTNTSRANRNHNSTTGASRAKSGSTAKQSAEFINAQNQYDKATGNSNSNLIRIRTNGGLK